ncbi:MAG: 1,4-dihydroxy-2-naphthoate octaprenyltransferase [Marinifilaceae bacterium]|jgi:1,4-dihydroxy-2-naphthoate octaprenyltransferase|nr:1,4-dihydroxy-2-naphthoate octaprenyltransferase [Marinifilaceae bacterium]
MNAKIKAWIGSFRLRTLPLSLSGVILGSFISELYGKFNLTICIYALLTTVFLQVLSNLSNDLGDSLKGTDNDSRQGPTRAMQTNLITKREMIGMIVVFILLSAFSGILLIYNSFDNLFNKGGIYMLVLGGLAIIAAIKYTLGKHAYGYIGLGDIFVFIFFGLASVFGTFYLYTGVFDPIILMPASSIGLLSIGVLNLNNIRDIENDKVCGKITIPVRIGERRAKNYHYFLIGMSGVLMILYVLFIGSEYFYLLLLPYSSLIKHLAQVKKLSGRALDGQLKVLSLNTLAFSLFTGFLILI